MSSFDPGIEKSGHPLPAGEFVRTLYKKGFDFFAGVPCSIFGETIALLTKSGTYIPAVREDDALGIAGGAYLAGKKPVVLMQNSGLGTSLNVLTSLHLIYKIPCLLIVSWRGYGGHDAPEHLIMGEACPRILDAIGLPHRIFNPATPLDSVTWAQEVMEEKRIPAALFLLRGMIC